MNCLICKGVMQPDVLKDTYHCPSCGFYASTLPISINTIDTLDERRRDEALKPVRLANFEQILDSLERIRSHAAPAQLLDVGCAHGWFLDIAASRNYAVTGIEPDMAMAAQARSTGHAVREGTFPQALNKEEVFDVITFNDVFEHIPDPAAVAEAARHHLAPHGSLVINLPVSDGFIFKLARSVGRVGVQRPLARLWQEGLPSPHVSYFSVQTLTRLLEQQGFVLQAHESLPAIRLRGLWQRVRYDTQTPLIKAALFYCAALVLLPILRLFPSDTHYFIFAPSDQN